MLGRKCREKVTQRRGRLTVHVDNGNVCSALHDSLTHDQSQASSTSSDDANLPFQRKGCQSPLKVYTTSALHMVARGQLMFLGMLELDQVICTGKSSLVLGSLV